MKAFVKTSSIPLSLTEGGLRGYCVNLELTEQVRHVTTITNPRFLARAMPAASLDDWEEMEVGDLLLANASIAPVLIMRESQNDRTI